MANGMTNTTKNNNRIFRRIAGSSKKGRDCYWTIQQSFEEKKAFLRKGLLELNLSLANRNLFSITRSELFKRPGLNLSWIQAVNLIITYYENLRNLSLSAPKKAYSQVNLISYSTPPESSTTYPARLKHPFPL
jgi:hypothetical protein